MMTQKLREVPSNDEAARATEMPTTAKKPFKVGRFRFIEIESSCQRKKPWPSSKRFSGVADSK